MEALTAIDHVAIVVDNITASVEWYRSQYQCEIEYQDESWAFLQFANIKLALVVKEQHPPHIAIEHPHPESVGETKHHRDGTRSTYIQDPSGNFIELIHYG